MNAIEFHNLTLGFAQKKLLTDFSMTIEQGEFIGIFGPNGAGKSTLLRTILGLLRPLGGHLHVYNQPPQRGNRNIGYMPQLRPQRAAHLLTAKTYLQAAALGLGWGLPLLNKPQRARLAEVITLTGLENIIDQPYAQLSGGERQRLGLAQALINQPQALLLDEPLSSLDLKQQEKMIALVKNIQQQLKITVLFTAHDINPLLQVMDRIIYLAQGKAAIGTVAEVVNSDTLSWLYDTPLEVIPWEQSLLVVHKKSGIFRDPHHHDPI